MPVRTPPVRTGGDGVGLHPRAGPGLGSGWHAPAKVREAHGTEACGRRRSWAVRGEGPGGRAARPGGGTVGLEGWWWVVSSPRHIPARGEGGCGRRFRGLGPAGQAGALLPGAPSSSLFLLLADIAPPAWSGRSPRPQTLESSVPSVVMHTQSKLRDAGFWLWDRPSSCSQAGGPGEELESSLSPAV